ncbi:nuA3 HAT complex component nto1 [Rhizophlyctis rosea]|nr:nuA3 HAT complex component nto1 [Rhizophlyctis rosea]
MTTEEPSVITTPTPVPRGSRRIRPILLSAVTTESGEPTVDNDFFASQFSETNPTMPGTARPLRERRPSRQFLFDDDSFTPMSEKSAMSSFDATPESSAAKASWRKSQGSRLRMVGSQREGTARSGISSPSLNPQPPAPSEPEVPIEERPYRELFPDLEPNAPLLLLRFPRPVTSPVESEMNECAANEQATQGEPSVVTNGAGPDTSLFDNAGSLSDADGNFEMDEDADGEYEVEETNNNIVDQEPVIPDLAAADSEEMIGTHTDTVDDASKEGLVDDEVAQNATEPSAAAETPPAELSKNTNGNDLEERQGSQSPESDASFHTAVSADADPEAKPNDLPLYPNPKASPNKGKGPATAPTTSHPLNGIVHSNGQSDIHDILREEGTPLESIHPKYNVRAHDDPYNGVSYPDALPAIPFVATKPIPKPSHRELPLDDEATLVKPKPVTSAYIRHFEPTEDELAERVEYDMDEQDLFWLNNMNVQRKQKTLPACDEDFFEKIMDRLEKEWFDLTKDMPKPDQSNAQFPEDTVCAICDDGECENSNAIVFCDGCNLAVHQDCYGVPYIPEGQWLCRKCMLSPEQPVNCIFCPNEGGAFKKTTTGQWAHLLCTLFIPEVQVGNPVFMEPVEHVEKVPKSRWKLQCYICKKRQGAPIQCAKGSCYHAFHPTCARKAKLFMRMRSAVADMRACCDKHTPKEWREKHDVDAALAAAQAQFSKSRGGKGKGKGGGKGKGFGSNIIRLRTSAVSSRAPTSGPASEVDDDDDEWKLTDDETEIRARRRKRHSVIESDEDEYEDSGELGSDEDALGRGSGRGKGKGKGGRGGRGRRRGGGVGRSQSSNRPSISTDATPSHDTTLSKAARAHAHQYAPPAPVVPVWIFNRVVEALRPDVSTALNVNGKEKGRIKKVVGEFEKKLDFMRDVCKYWSLKREARRGAPLLKRLHLEPWTASATANKEDEEMKARRYQTITYIRQDLERVRLLCELVRNRERNKLRVYGIYQAYFEHVLHPVCHYTKPVVEKLKAMDKSEFFWREVTPEMAPDYADFIKEPMWFGRVEEKLAGGVYRRLEEVERDLDLIWANCVAYNKPDTEYCKMALKLQKRSDGLLAEVEEKLSKLPIDVQSGVMDVPISPLIFSYGLPEGYVEPEVAVSEIADAATAEKTPRGRRESRGAVRAGEGGVEGAEVRVTRARAVEIAKFEEERETREKEERIREKEEKARERMERMRKGRVSVGGGEGRATRSRRSMVPEEQEVEKGEEVAEGEGKNVGGETAEQVGERSEAVESARRSTRKRGKVDEDTAVGEETKAGKIGGDGQTEAVVPAEVEIPESETPLTRSSRRARRGEQPQAPIQPPIEAPEQVQEDKQDEDEAPVTRTRASARKALEHASAQPEASPSTSTTPASRKRRASEAVELPTRSSKRKAVSNPVTPAPTASTPATSKKGHKGWVWVSDLEEPTGKKEEEEEVVDLGVETILTRNKRKSVLEERRASLTGAGPSDGGSGVVDTPPVRRAAAKAALAVSEAAKGGARAGRSQAQVMHVQQVSTPSRRRSGRGVESAEKSVGGVSPQTRAGKRGRGKEKDDNVEAEEVSEQAAVEEPLSKRPRRSGVAPTVLSDDDQPLSQRTKTIIIGDSGDEGSSSHHAPVPQPSPGKRRGRPKRNLPPAIDTNLRNVTPGLDTNATITAHSALSGDTTITLTPPPSAMRRSSVVSLTDGRRGSVASLTGGRRGSVASRGGGVGSSITSRSGGSSSVWSSPMKGRGGGGGIEVLFGDGQEFERCDLDDSADMGVFLKEAGAGGRGRRGRRRESAARRMEEEEDVGKGCGQTPEFGDATGPSVDVEMEKGEEGGEGAEDGEEGDDMEAENGEPGDEEGGEGGADDDMEEQNG